MESRQIALILFTLTGIIQIYEIFKNKEESKTKKFFRVIVLMILVYYYYVYYQETKEIEEFYREIERQKLGFIGIF